MSIETAVTAETAAEDAAERFTDPDEIESLLQIPSLGFLPQIDEPGLRLIRDISTFSPLMESFRTLRTNLYFATETPLRSLVVTSSVPAEGKSTTTANLAMALALDGKRIIIVDADLRRPAQHKIFKLDSTPGLTDVLRDDCTVKKALRPTTVANVRVLPAGNPPPNPAELLGSGNITRLLAELERHCDIVLLDTPPTLAVADGPIVASQAGGVLLVLAYGETKKVNAQQCVKILARCRAKIVGTALNRMQGTASGYYYGKYYVPTETEPSDSPPVEVGKVVIRRRERKARKV